MELIFTTNETLIDQTWHSIMERAAILRATNTDREIDGKHLAQIYRMKKIKNRKSNDKTSQARKEVTYWRDQYNYLAMF